MGCSSSPSLSNIYICDDCCRAQGRKYPHSRTVGHLTWAQYVKHKTEECPHRVLPTTKKANNPNLANESVNMSESISAKISKMNPLPDAEVACRIYEKWKAEKEEKGQSAATSAISDIAREAEQEVKAEKNKEKAENKKKNKAGVAKKK